MVGLVAKDLNRAGPGGGRTRALHAGGRFRSAAKDRPRGLNVLQKLKNKIPICKTIIMCKNN